MNKEYVDNDIFRFRIALKDEFKSDTEMLMPKYYNQEDGKKMSLKDSLAMRFPGLIIPENPPMFEGSEYSEKEQPHDI